MSDYFDHVERELRTAVRTHAHLPWYVRLRLRHSRALVVVLAGLIIAGPALAAVSLLQGGSSVAPNVPQTPNAFNGVALSTGVRTLPLRTADPAGGPAWGVRLIRTSRGLLCLQVGRVAFESVGALGTDDAFHNDGRFHPFSPNYEPDPNACVPPDGQGNGFLDIAAIGVPASALFSAGARAGGCTSARSPFKRHPACPERDLRDIYYGLLGPDGISVTHLTSSGSIATTPTVGPDGAYLIVLPDQGPVSQNDSSTYGSSPFAGAIRVVHYSHGRMCRLPALGRLVEIGQGRCPVFGYVPAAVHPPTEAQVASPITARIESAKHYCEKGITDVIVPCPAQVPKGFTRIGGRLRPGVKPPAEDSGPDQLHLARPDHQRPQLLLHPDEPAAIYRPAPPHRTGMRCRGERLRADQLRLRRWPDSHVLDVRKPELPRPCARRHQPRDQHRPVYARSDARSPRPKHRTRGGPIHGHGPVSRHGRSPTSFLSYRVVASSFSAAQRRC